MLLAPGQPFTTVHERGLGTLDLFPLSLDEAFLFGLFEDLFLNHWQCFQIGPWMQGGVMEISLPQKPHLVKLFDGYVTVEAADWVHLHICIGETTGKGCEPTPHDVAEHRRPSAAQLYRKRGAKHGHPMIWGFRVLNGKGEQSFNLLINNPLLRGGKHEPIDVPDWSRLALWDHLRAQYLGLHEQDPDDRLATHFHHD